MYSLPHFSRYYTASKTFLAFTAIIGWTGQGRTEVGG